MWHPYLRSALNITPFWLPEGSGYLEYWSAYVLIVRRRSSLESQELCPLTRKKGNKRWTWFSTLRSNSPTLPGNKLLKKVSHTHSGKNFILKLLKKNPNERPKPDELLKDPWFERFAGVTMQRVYNRKKPGSPKRPGSRSPGRVSSNYITMKISPSEFKQEKLQHQFHESNLDVEIPDDEN